MGRARQALGNEAVESLGQRVLLWELDGPGGADGAAPAVRLDRVAGIITGLTAGNAEADGRVGMEAQTFVLTAEAWLDHGWHGPPVLVEQLSRERDTLRLRGEAIATAVAAHRAGVPWHLAASTSYGNGALSRAAAIGGIFAGKPRAASLAASIDTAVTHAERSATASSAALAAIVAQLVDRGPQVNPIDVVRAAVARCPEPVGRLLQRASAAVDRGTDLRREGPWGIRADETLAVSVWSALAHQDPADAVAAARALDHIGRAAGAVTGALVGAIRGAATLPAAWASDVEGAAVYPALARRIAAGIDPADAVGGDARADIWFLLDRSGSMSSIAREVVTGFDAFFASQRARSGAATVTVVQFDDHDAHDVILDAGPLGSVGSIAERFSPRGSTPLYDAVGLLLDRAERRGGDDADQLVVVFTDGAENASRNWTQQRLFARIGDLRQRGWTFVFLGANQDSYASGGGLGFQDGNTSNFAPSAAGVRATYTGLDRTVSEWRDKSRAARRRDRDDFWGGRKEAEEADGQ